MRPGGLKIAVCACTFRRPEGLAAMLERLTEQRFRRIQAPEVLIIVADNEGSARMHALCAKFVAAHGLRLVYLVVKIIQKSPAAIRLERREPPR